MADIDNFKKINDSYGHLTGGAVLRATSDRMHSLMRSYDYIGRYGGEEFLIILPDCDSYRAVAFAERLRLSVEGDGFETPEGLIPVTISLGVASSHDNVVMDGELLVKAADSALYLAKANGRNMVNVFSCTGAGPREEIVEKMSIC